MPVTISLEKDATLDRVRISPNPLRIRLTQNADPDGRVRVRITAGASLANRPGAAKSTSFRFRNAAMRALFEEVAGPETIVLTPGQTLELTVRNTLGLQNRPTAGPNATPFRRQANGQPDPAFTRVADLVFVDPPAAEQHDHGGVEIEN